MAYTCICYILSYLYYIRSMYMGFNSLLWCFSYWLLYCLACGQFVPCGLHVCLWVWFTVYLGLSVLGWHVVCLLPLLSLSWLIYWLALSYWLGIVLAPYLLPGMCCAWVGCVSILWLGVLLARCLCVSLMGLACVVLLSGLCLACTVLVLAMGRAVLRVGALFGFCGWLCLGLACGRVVWCSVLVVYLGGMWCAWVFGSLSVLWQAHKKKHVADRYML
jgi:hypothetical protein